MTAHRIDTVRRSLVGAALATPFVPAFVPHARAADVPRFALGIASGHARADGVVLWTRLTGADLPDTVDVTWELASDDAFKTIVARGTESVEAAWSHSVHAEPAALEPGRFYWYRFRALGQQSAVGRTRTAPAPGDAATLRFAITNCQRWDVGHYAAWRDIAAQDLDVVMFLGDYIYEYASPAKALRRHEGGAVTTLDQYRARYATYKSDPALQAAHAAHPWLMVWDDHEVQNDYAGLQGQLLQPDFKAQRTAAYQAYWENMPFPKALRPRGADMRITGRFDWGTLARIHLLDDRQYRDPQVCPKPGKGGSNTVALKDCPELLDRQRTLLGREQEASLADGWDLKRPWNLVAQQTLMARLQSRTEAGDTRYWTDGWDGYAPSRERLLDVVAGKKVPGVVVLGGDVHSHFVADLKADFDNPKSAVLASEFCASSITSLGGPQERLDKALALNPHLHYGHSDQRGYMRFVLDAKRLRAEVMAVDDITDPASVVRVAARFAVEAGDPSIKAA